MKKTDLLLLLLGVAGGAYSYSVVAIGGAQTTAPRAASTSPGGIPSSFFGMRTSANAPWPSVPFGTYRVFHNGITWDYLAKQGRNNYRTPFGQSTFKTLDDLLEEGARRGVTQVWYTLYGVANWASSNPSDSNCAELPGSCDPPSDLDATAPCQGPLSGVTTTDCQFKEFMTGFMDHVCSGTAPNKKCKVTAFGCWNEPNADQFWTGTAEQMAELCADMATIVRSQCQTCLVIPPEPASGAGSPRFHKRNGEAGLYSAWMRLFLRVSARYNTTFDAAAWHSFPSLSSKVNPAPMPETYRGSGCSGGGGGNDCPNLLTEKISIMREIFDRAPRAAGKPQWTEGSWGMDSGLTDPDMQAAFLARWFLIQGSSGVEVASWYSWGENHVRPTDWGSLWDGENGIHKAGVAYRQMYDWLVGATFAGPCSGRGNVWSCTLTRPDGYQGEVVWDVSKSCRNGSCSTADYQPGSQFVKYRDLSGKTVAIHGGSVPIGPLPLLFENR